MIWGVWKVLRFEAKSETKVVRLAALAGFSVEKISGIELNAWFCSPYFHRAAGCRFFHFGSERRRVTGFSIQHPIVVVAVSEFKLFVLLIDTGTDGDGSSEVEWSAFHTTKFAGGN